MLLGVVDLSNSSVIKICPALALVVYSHTSDNLCCCAFERLFTTLDTFMICTIPATDVSSSERRPTAPLMLLSHCGEYPCEFTKLIFAVNSPKMIRLARRITETSEVLQIVTNACEFLTNHCEFLTKLTIT